MENQPAFNISSVVLSFLKNRLSRNLNSVTLFGSRVKGGYKKHSDFDFFVVCKTLPDDPNKINELSSNIVADFLFEFGYRISLTILSKPQAIDEFEAHSPLLLSLLTGYKILYDENNFMAKILETLKMKASLIYKEKGETWNLKRAV